MDHTYSFTRGEKILKPIRRVCSVPQCSNNERTPRVSFHSFPLEASEKKTWVAKLRIGKKVPKFGRVCSDHFGIDDFFSATDTSVRRRLKKGAIPSQKLPLRPLDVQVSPGKTYMREERRLRREANDTITRMAPTKKMRGSGSCCAVATCGNTSRKSKMQGEQLFFYRFPIDPAIRKQWIYKCHRNYTFNPDSFRVCSKHFTPEDCEDLLKAQLLGLVPKKLKKDAIPSLHLGPLEITPKTESCAMSMVKEEREIMSTPEYTENNTDTSSPSEDPLNCSNETCQKLRHHCETLELQLETLTQSLQSEERKNNELQKMIDETLRSNNAMIKNLKDMEVKYREESPFPWEEKMKVALRPCFKTNQVDSVLKK